MGFVSRLFAPKIPKIEIPSVSARDLVPNVTGAEPKAPTMLADDTLDRTKKKGYSSMITGRNTIRV